MGMSEEYRQWLAGFDTVPAHPNDVPLTEHNREAARLATLAQFPVGTVWRCIGQVRHIRAVIDETQFVYRVWSKHRGAWDYDIVYWHMLYLEMQEQAR